MKYNKETYIKLGLITLLAFSIAWFFPTTDFIKGILAAPGAVTLLVALFQIVRDQAAWEKEKYFEERKRVFDIGATSHMANAVFDKHVIFCEKYIEELYKTLVTLFRNRPTTEAITHANKLTLLRQEYAAWLTNDITSDLELYEGALRKFGADAGFVEDTLGVPEYNKDRQETIKRNYEMVRKLVKEIKHKEVDENYAIESVIEKVRAILGIGDLTKIRKYLIEEATKAIEEKKK